MTTKSNCFSRRIGDTSLVFAMERYANASKKEFKPDIWRFEVMHGYSNRPLIEIDATVKALTDMRRFIDEALAQITPSQPEPAQEETADAA